MIKYLINIYYQQLYVILQNVIITYKLKNMILWVIIQMIQLLQNNVSNNKPLLLIEMQKIFKYNQKMNQKYIKQFLKYLIQVKYNFKLQQFKNQIKKIIQIKSSMYLLKVLNNHFKHMVLYQVIHSIEYNKYQLQNKLALDVFIIYQNI